MPTLYIKICKLYYLNKPWDWGPGGQITWRSPVFTHLIYAVHIHLPCLLKGGRYSDNKWRWQTAEVLQISLVHSSPLQLENSSLCHIFLFTSRWLSSHRGFSAQLYNLQVSTSHNLSAWTSTQSGVKIFPSNVILNNYCIFCGWH